MFLDKRRVCIVAPIFYPPGTNVKREAEALGQCGCDVKVICLRDPGKPFHQKIDGVDVYRMPVKHRKRRISRYLIENPSFFILSSLQLLYLHLKNRIDVAQIDAAPDYLAFIALFPRLTGTKVILSVREPVLEYFETVFRKWYERIILYAIKLSEKLSILFADRVVTVTREMRDNFGKRGADINNINVVVGLPEDALFNAGRYDSIRDKINTIRRKERRRGIFRILCHGEVDEEYGLDIVVRALAHVKHRLPGVQFRFTGDGVYLHQLMELAKTLKVEDQMICLGSVSSRMAVEEILASDAGIIPAKKNPYSVLVHRREMYEFIALAKPVIASYLNAVASYFPEESIVYFEPGNDADLAEKIYYVFAHPEEMNRRVSVAMEICGTLGWEREGKKYLSLYQSLLSGGAR